MITTNVSSRTFFVKFGSSTGTAFTVEHDSKQYLVTARHVIEGIKSGDAIDVFHDRQWKRLVVQVVGIGEEESDIAVLAAPLQVSPTWPLEASAGGMMLGQQVYFLGFPFGWDGGGEHITNGYPMPFVKSGVLSAIIAGNPNKIYLDAHVNEGFSGGPIVFMPGGQPQGKGVDFKLAGVVVNFPTPVIRPVVNSDGEQFLDQNNNPIGIRENPGFVVAINVRHAIELIDQNPIGFPVPANPDGS